MDKLPKDNPYMESIAIVGGGITGIAAAIELAKSRRFQVTLFEKQNHLGGLSSYYQWRDVVWDRFYHVILSTDTVMLEFIKELGLQDKFFWRDTKTGFYSKGRLVSFSSTLDFIKFPFMTLWQKFRMGLGILYSSRIKDPSKLDKIYVKQWLTKIFGRRVYEQIWEPLLRSKLGNARERTSAAFIWATINRLYGARSSGTKQEKMGHVKGGYHTILETAEKKLVELGVKIMTNSPVLKCEKKPQNPNISSRRLSSSKQQLSDKNNQPKKQIKLTTKNDTFKFDKVLFTTDCPTVLQMVNSENNHPYWSQLKQVEYLGVICVLLILNRKLSPYYVINLLDRDLPFTGIVEATNIVSPKNLDGKHLVYLPKYLPGDDSFSNMEEDKIIDLFVDKLKKVFPDLKEEEILHRQLFRETYVQPLQDLNYLQRTTEIITPIKGLYLVNTSMNYNSTLNNNAAIMLAHKAVKTILDDDEK